MVETRVKRVSRRCRLATVHSLISSPSGEFFATFDMGESSKSSLILFTSIVSNKHILTDIKFGTRDNTKDTGRRIFTLKIYRVIVAYRFYLDKAITVIKSFFLYIILIIYIIFDIKRRNA